MRETQRCIGRRDPPDATGAHRRSKMPRGRFPRFTGHFMCSEDVARDGVEPPTFRFSGGATALTSRDGRRRMHVADRAWVGAVAVVAVTVAVRRRPF
ncbi:hypothetical protein GCM10023224_26700 [Streptomonospora halophila]|uniref:Uncharacterized protein n=1 Tax=Streptomonospora halophila TaxID=427369 RepID=A0ABP9GGL4_9ACTN